MNVLDAGHQETSCNCPECNVLASLKLLQLRCRGGGCYCCSTRRGGCRTVVLFDDVIRSCCKGKFLNHGATFNTLHLRVMHRKWHQPVHELHLIDAMFRGMTFWHTEQAVRRTRSCRTVLAWWLERDEGGRRVWSDWEPCFLVWLRRTVQLNFWLFIASGGAVRELGVNCSVVEMVVTVSVGCMGPRNLWSTPLWGLKIASPIAFVTPNRGEVWMKPFSANTAEIFFRNGIALNTYTDQEDKEQPYC